MPPRDFPAAAVQRLPRLLVIFLFTALSAGFSPAQEAHLSPEKQTQIEAAVSKFMTETHVPGLSVAVVENGQVEWASGFGFADVENNAPATEHTLFRLASISKSLSAVGAMQLWEHGQLDLDAPVHKYCPAFPDKSKAGGEKSGVITTRLAMGHLAGIRHYKSESEGDLEVGNTRHFDNPIQGGLDFFKNDPLVAQPGSEFHYSTQGYTLVGCVMEGASGAKYTELMRQNVIVPAGMQHTQVDDRFAIVPYRTRFYQKTQTGEVQNADFLDSSYKIPGGGWLSSAEDMAAFEVAILNDKLLKRSTRDLMWRPLNPKQGKPNGYALGWGTFEENGIRYVSHSGGQQGTSTDFLMAPELRTAVVVLTNMDGLPANDLSKQMMKILLAAAASAPKK